MGFLSLWSSRLYLVLFLEEVCFSSPKDDPDISEEELTYIQENAPASDIDDPLPVKQLLFNKPLWAITVAHFCNNYSLFVFLSWLPAFISEGLGVPWAAVGFLAMLPHLTALFYKFGRLFFRLFNKWA